jgi:D-glycero-alpha-D-manno-heptose-7-phosphate kinase
MSLVHSNLRVDISGGTLDLWPLFNFVGGAKTINTALSLKASCQFQWLENQNVEVSVTNLDFKKSYKNLKELLDSKDHQIDILKPVLRNYKFSKGFKIETRSESPVGGGLGGSSTLLVSIIRSIDEALNLERNEAATVDFACNLESEILNTPAGTQDYFQAVKPGLSLIQYSAEGRKREFFSSPWLNNVKSQFKLIYSGHPHHSGLNNWQIFQKCVQGDKETLSILKSLKEVSEMVYFDMHTATGSNMSNLLTEELELRRRLATGYVNPPLEKIIKFLHNMDLNQFKICGAGGGGCLWALVPEELNKDLQKVKDLHSEIQIIDCELLL